MDSLIPLIISLISGAAGGNIVGTIAKQISLGTLGNSLAGIVGGGLGKFILDSLMGAGTMATTAGGAAAASGLDIGAILQQVAGGGAGGGLLMVIIGILRSMLAKG
ncbi:MAG: hypothetical protein R3D33_16790 [Hyphomicrobiaceae bacterium]